MPAEDGRYVREKFPASYSEKQAHDRWAEINVVFNTIIETARHCLATPEGQRQISVALDRAIEQTENAISVLLRVFLELSVDAYIDRVGVSISADAKLRQKLLAVVTDLLNRQKLNRQQANPVRKAFLRHTHGQFFGAQYMPTGLLQYLRVSLSGGRLGAY